MNTALVIYLADISEPLKVTSALLAFFSCVFIPIILVNVYASVREAKKGIIIGLIFIFVHSTIAVVYPSEKAIYKMAGVTEQEKGKINAIGEVK